jgi:hypothetical protein
MIVELYKQSQKVVIPSRTRYELRHFVIGQHDTLEMQYRQLLIEAQDLGYKIRMAELDCEKKKIKIHKLLSTGDPVDSIKAEQKKLALQLTERTLAGARLEFDWLREMAEEIGEYSLQEIEDGQEAYWQARLTRQAGVDQMSRAEGISAGNLESMRLAGLLTKEGGEKCAIAPGN